MTYGQRFCRCSRCEGKVMQIQGTAYYHERKYPAAPPEQDLDDDDDKDQSPEPEAPIPDVDEEDEEDDFKDFFFPDEDPAVGPTEVLCRQVLELVSTKQMTQKGCDLMLKMLANFHSNEDADPETLPPSFYLAKKLADIQSSSNLLG